MNRRNFFRAGAMSAISLPRLSEHLLAQSEQEADARNSVSPRRRVLDLLHKALTSPVVGFPTIQPLFGGIFLPGGNATQLVNANSWAAFNSQLQTLASGGYRLASLAAIQSNKTTSYYGAFEQGSGNFVALHTADPNQFQQSFTQNRAGYRLVDFAITWEQGQLYYAAYWLATSSPANQTLVFDVDFNTLVNRWNTLSGQGQRMTRVQAFPKNDAASYAALFEPGNGQYIL